MKSETPLAASARKRCPPLTSAGESASCRAPLPTAPSTPRPQHCACPSLVSAHVPVRSATKDAYVAPPAAVRSEERRVGKEGRDQRWREHEQRKAYLAGKR